VADGVAARAQRMDVGAAVEGEWQDLELKRMVPN
jgi:hypothetical protein